MLGRMPPRITSVPTAIAAFVGRTTEGPIGAPAPVASAAEFDAVFGGLSLDSALGYAVHHFFANGGQQAVVVRVAAGDGDSIQTGSLAECVARAAANVIGDPEGPTGLHALAPYQFTLLCVPPLVFSHQVDGKTIERVEADVPPEVWSVAAELCRQRRALLIIDAPRAWTISTASAQIQAFAPIARANAAIYFPRVRIPDPLQGNALRDFAPCGCVAGIIARTDAARGVWKPPAGRDATVDGAADLSIAGAPADLRDSQLDALNQRAINCLRIFPGAGPVVWGARTLDGDDAWGSEWKYIPVRRLALFIEESVTRGTSWAAGEPNDEPLWAALRAGVSAFLHDLFRQGAFAGSRPQDAYYVQCGAGTMTADEIDQGRVGIDIGFAPLKPAEFVRIRIQQMARGARS